MRRGIGVVLALLLWAAGAAGQDPSPRSAPAPDALDREAQQRYAEELAVCAAFYLVASEAARRQEDSTWARVYTSLASILLDRAAEAGDEDLVMARAKAALREMFAGLDREMSDLSGLWKAHAETCAVAYNHPEELLDKWRVLVRPRP